MRAGAGRLIKIVSDCARIGSVVLMVPALLMTAVPAAAGDWAWITGPGPSDPGLAAYGTKGVAAPSNTPGQSKAEERASWRDKSGNFWLFDGALWKYDVSAGNWTWMNGSEGSDDDYCYGTQGAGDPANTPGHNRSGAATWTDSAGNLWLFGGITRTNRCLNDLWKYDAMSANWIWMKGSNSFTTQPGVYGTQGVADTANTPGGRCDAVSWTDQSGNLWLFGGWGGYYLNDLWKYDVASNKWTWMKGANVANQYGTYGTQGTSSPANTPGARMRAVSWTDDFGRLWLFGGVGSHPSVGQVQIFNDLWVYTPTTGDWTWMRGSTDELGVYGTLGVMDSANTPGARTQAVSWTDRSGNLWLFGGARATSILSDLWKYDVAAQCWVWMKGAKVPLQGGTYGTQGVADPANVPGARIEATPWTDNSGNLWLFGGVGYAASGQGCLNDLWKYDLATGAWTWKKGSCAVYPYGSYGTRGVYATTNNPGNRSGAVTWTDNRGDLWLFGGFGSSASDRGVELNDLWKYNVATGHWVWMNGSSTSQSGSYGAQGVADPANTPGGRHGAVSWTDKSGNLWLFGGYCDGYLNDLWKYDVVTNSWIWMKGSKTHDQAGVYGSVGIADPASTPGARDEAVSWTDESGDLWLFGGHAWYVSSNLGRFNDLWKYDVVANNWTWMKGSNSFDQPEICGSQGVADATNAPGARDGAVSWKDNSGNLWLFGGFRYTSSTQSLVNDLWKYNVASGCWTSVSGSRINGQPSVCGTQGVADSLNTPGARRDACSWTDDWGHLWLFGGNGVDCNCYTGYLNDLWKYDIATDSWTWMKGSSTAPAYGEYNTFGTQGLAAPDNTPSARYDSASWTDSLGNLWLFGGSGLSGDYKMEMWRYSLVTAASSNWMLLQ